MQEQGQTLTPASTEVVAVFHDVGSLQASIDELLTKAVGFDHADLSVLANESDILKKLGRSYQSTRELEDDPDVPRVGYIPNESVGNAEGGIIAAAAYVPAIIGSVAVVSSGGTLLGAIAIAALAGGAGAAVGALLARLVGHEHAKHLNEHLDRGGVLLWVRTHGPEQEKAAVNILLRHGGEDVHLHTLPPSHLPSEPIPTHRPLLSFSDAG
jgi:hypothetical protein